MQRYACVPAYLLIAPFKRITASFAFFLTESQMNVLIRVKPVLICRQLMSYFDWTRISNDLKNSTDVTVKQSTVISNELGYVFFAPKKQILSLVNWFVFDNNAI